MFYIGSKMKKDTVLKGKFNSVSLVKTTDNKGNYARVIFTEENGEKSALECSEQIVSSLADVKRGDSIEISALMRPGKKKTGELFDRAIFVVEKIDTALA